MLSCRWKIGAGDLAVRISALVGKTVRRCCHVAARCSLGKPSLNTVTRIANKRTVYEPAKKKENDCQANDR
jgi:hypothetical protein